MKLKGSLWKFTVAVVWLACLGFIGTGALLLGGLDNTSLEQARRALQESQDKLAFAQNAGKDQTRQRFKERLSQTSETVKTFTCAPEAESALIFQIGQLAQSLELKKFTGRVPESQSEKTLEKSDRIAEGWLAVEFVADYLKIAAFVNSLECNIPLLFIESISLRQSDENNQEASVKIDMSYLIQKSRPAKTVAQNNAEN